MFHLSDRENRDTELPILESIPPVIDKIMMIILFATLVLSIVLMVMILKMNLDLELRMEKPK